MSLGRGALADALRSAGLSPALASERPVTRQEQIGWITRRLDELRGRAADRQIAVADSIRGLLERHAQREAPHAGLARAGSRDALGRAVHEQHAQGARDHGEPPPPPWQRLSEQAKECYRRQGEAVVAAARASGVLP